MVNSQRMPAETCKPWHPTSAKKADRNALREGPAPRAMRSANSRNSMIRKPIPSTQVTAIATWNQRELRTSAAMLAMPQAKLDNNKKAVSIATFLRLKSSAPLGPPAVCPNSTA
jgi:hypothetical protein